MSALLAVLNALPGEVLAPAAEAWPALLSEAEAHGLTGLLEHHLSAHVPPELTKRLSTSAQASAARALRLKRLLLEVLDGLSAQSIVPVLLKGYGVSTRYWPEWHLRPSGDVDVLVRPEELPIARRMLLGRGFVTEEPRHGDEHTHHVAFAGRGGAVELHFRAFEGPGGGALEGPALFERARGGKIDGRPVLYLPLEEEVVYLASHAAAHLFQRVAWLYDLKLMIAAHPELSWPRVVEVARATHLRGGTFAALCLAVSKLGAAVPAQVVAGLAPTRAHRWLLGPPSRSTYLATGALAKSAGAPLLRALFADSPVRAARHLIEGAVRRARRSMRARGASV